MVAAVFPDSQTPLQKEPSEVPTPKRPRGRPKGSKNKGAAAKTRVSGAAQLWGLANCGKWGTQDSGE